MENNIERVLQIFEDLLIYNFSNIIRYFIFYMRFIYAKRNKGNIGSIANISSQRWRLYTIFSFYFFFFICL